MMERWDVSENHFWDNKKWRAFFKSTLNVDERKYSCPHRLSGREFMKARNTLPSSSLMRPNENETSSFKRLHPTGVCVEAGTGNFRALQKAASMLGYSVGSEFGSLHFVHGAVLDKASPGQAIDSLGGLAGEE